MVIVRLSLIVSNISQNRYVAELHSEQSVNPRRLKEYNLLSIFYETNHVKKKFETVRKKFDVPIWDFHTF